MRKDKRFTWTLLVPLMMVFYSSLVTAGEEQALGAGVSWLREKSAPDGSFGKVVDSRGTALAVTGLMEAGEDISREVTVLGSRAPGSVEEAVFRLLGTRDPSHQAEVTSRQSPDGSFGSLEMTALAVLALAQSGATANQAVGFLQSQQNPDGSFGPEGNIADSALVTLALYLAGSHNLDGFEYILKNQHPSGGFGSVAASAWSLLCLRTYGGHPLELNAASNYLASVQSRGGGWSLSCTTNDCQDDPPDVSTTGLCLWALAGSGVDSAAALSFIRQAQDMGGLWSDPSRSIKVTATVTDVLSHLQEAPAVRAAGWAYLTTARAANSDQEARRLAALIEGEINVGEAMEAFLANQDPSSGEWPLAPGYGGDVMVTALALGVMDRAHFYDGTIESRAVNYLKEAVNADHGWGYTKGADSSLAVTTE